MQNIIVYKENWKEYDHVGTLRPAVILLIYSNNFELLQSKRFRCLQK